PGRAGGLGRAHGPSRGATAAGAGHAHRARPGGGPAQGPHAGGRAAAAVPDPRRGLAGITARAWVPRWRPGRPRLVLLVMGVGMPAPKRDAAAAQRGRTLTEALGPDALRNSTASGGLDGGQREELLDTLVAVLGGAYAHLPAKRAAYAVDPVQALILLRRRAADLSEADFH